MEIKLTHIFVDGQAEPFEFYTTILGFIKKEDIEKENTSSEGRVIFVDLRRDESERAKRVKG